MVCIWIASFKSNLSLNVYGGMENALRLNWMKRKCVCMYCQPLELMAAKNHWHKPQIVWCFKDWSIDRLIDWSIYLLAKNNTPTPLDRWLPSVICQKCAEQRQLHTVTPNSYSSMFLLHCIWYGVQVLQVLSLLDSTDKSNHLSHSCDKPALERFKCQVVFVTSTAGLRLNLSLVYAATLPLLCCKMWNCLVYANGNCLAR